jgi:hypothetical protein
MTIVRAVHEVAQGLILLCRGFDCARGARQSPLIMLEAGCFSEIRPADLRYSKSASLIK